MNKQTLRAAIKKAIDNTKATEGPANFIEAIALEVEAVTEDGSLALAILEDPLFKNAADTLAQLEIVLAVFGRMPAVSIPSHLHIIFADAQLAVARSKGERE